MSDRFAAAGESRFATPLGFATALAACRDVDEIADAAIKQSQERLEAIAAALYHVTEQGGSATLLRATGFPPVPAEELQEMLSAALREGRTVTSVEKVAGFPCVAAVPLTAPGGTVGALVVAWSTVDPCSELELSFLEAIGSIVGAMLATAWLRQQLERNRDRLRALAMGNMKAREDEARRLARDLHDEGGQLLASVYIALDEIALEVPDPMRDRLVAIRAELDLIQGHLRRIAHELRPKILDDLGLLPALEFLMAGVQARTGIPIAMDSALGSTSARLPSAVETALYRIMQEALTNAVRHGRPGQIRIGLWQEEGNVFGSIHDTGVGFDAVGQDLQGGRHGLGLIGIQERLEALGGTLQITSEPGRGTDVLVTIPVSRGGENGGTREEGSVAAGGE